MILAGVAMGPLRAKLRGLVRVLETVVRKRVPSTAPTSVLGQERALLILNMKTNFLFKRGVSPVVATTLLIAIVIALAGIVFIWAQGFVQEGVHKRGEPIERSYDSLNFEADVVPESGSYTLEINNRADIPIYGFVVRVLGEGETLIEELPPTPVEPGASLRISLATLDLTGISELTVVPILLGRRGDSGNEAFICPDRTGQGVTLL